MSFKKQVNNAATFKLSGIKDTEMSEYDDIMNTNLRSVFILTQLCVPHLIPVKGMSYILIGPYVLKQNSFL